MRGVAEMKFSSLFVQISTLAAVCLVRFGEKNDEIINVYVKFEKSKNGLFLPWEV